MSKQNNYGGRSYVVDRIIELYNGSSSTSSIANIKQLIGAQQSIKDLGDIKEEIDKATSDGVITPSEKKGLKREWATLFSSWLNIQDIFSKDENLSKTAQYQILKKNIESLTEIMNRVFEDMDSDYIGEDISKITDLFVSSWDYITLCSQLISDKQSLLERHRLEVEGNREIVSSVELKAKLFLLENGFYIDVTDLEDYPDSDFTWSKPDDEEFEYRKGRILSLSIEDMKGSSTAQFSLTFSHEYKTSNDKEKSIKVNLSIIFDIKYGKKIQYAWSNAETVSELMQDWSVVWTDDVTENSRERLYLWKRESSDLSKPDNEKVWIYFRETGPKGETGPQGPQGEAGENAPETIMEYQYSDSDRTAPIKIIPFIFGGGLVYFRGSAVVDANNEDWQKDPPRTGKYKWMRSSTDGGKTWDYSVLNGPEPSFFELFFSKDNFRQNERGAVDIEDKIQFWVVRHNMSAGEKPAWSVFPEELMPDKAYINSESIEVVVPKGYELGSFTVSVKVGQKSETLSKTVYGQINGTVTARKLRTIDRTTNPPEEFPMLLEDGVSPVKDGDYLLVKLSDNGKPYLVPYRYSERINPSTGTIEGWVPLENNPSDITDSSELSDWSVIMSNVSQEIFASSQTIPSSSAIYSFVKNFLANNAFIKMLISDEAFIKNLVALSLLVKSSDNKFSFEISSNKEEPVIKAVYDSKTIFQIVPKTGRIFLGEPDQKLTGASSGFMYDPILGSLKSNNGFTEIKNNGELSAINMKAVNANITGDSNFEGIFNCVSIYAKKSEDTIVYSEQYSGYKQAENITKHFKVSEGETRGFRCNVSFLDAIKYMVINVIDNSPAYTRINIIFQDQNHNKVDISPYTSEYRNNYTDTLDRSILSYFYIYNSYPSRPQEGATYILSGFTLTEITDGNILKMNIPSNLSSDGLAKLEKNQIYASDDGTLKIKQ